ncbi:SIR2 family protein [Paraburkholderia tropica]|uniref:SIR2 family protein n=1 Tax=Paraburkholderia tropica TaxID=92647 RepID=UPI002ABD5D93|nr:SIR2 family protein [Paraburkholderia tropica]
MTNQTTSVAGALADFFQKSSFPILFTGAGVSMLAGLPDWKGLLNRMAETIRPNDPMTATQITHYVARGSLTKAADFFWITDETLESDKHLIIKTILDEYDARPLKHLASLPFKGVITTNFDRSILDAIALAGRQVPRDYRLGDASFGQATWETEPYVARIHGCAEFPQSMVLSERQFEKLLANDAYIDLLTQIFLHREVLFLGFSFYDPAIRYVLEQIERRFGVAPPGRHMAILPESNASELIQKASRLNIAVIKYDESNKHEALWSGIAEFADTTKRVQQRASASIDHPYSKTKQYLAACYARVSVASENTPLREIVIEGILSASLQREHPKSLGLLDLRETVRTALGIKGKDVDQIVEAAIKELIDAKLVRKHRVEGAKGNRFAWIGDPDATSTLNDAIECLKSSLMDRAHVQEGWRPPPHVADTLALFLREIVHRRGWDLGAAFAAGKAPDNLAFRPVLAECAHKLSAFDRERVERTIESLFQHPTEREAELLGELGRISFAVELAFQAPHTTLLHRATLPQRIYFDTNLLLPTFIDGHPHHQTYVDLLGRIKSAASKAGNKLQLTAYSGYLNEMISHKNAAMAYAKEAGDNFEALARSDALYHGPGNINVFVGAYVNSVENGHPRGFEAFLKRVSPYTTETELRRWIEKNGFVVVDSVKNGVYGKLYPTLEQRNATRLSNGKQPILVEHDALQLSLLDADHKKGERALFATADRQLYEDVASSSFKHLTEFMVSHIGIVQFVDLLVGLKSDDRTLGELLWSNKVSEKAQRIRSYLTVEALSKYDAAMAMTLHSVVEAQSEDIAKKLDRQGADLESHDPTTRVKAFKSLGTLEANFFSGLSEQMSKKKR